MMRFFAYTKPTNRKVVMEVSQLLAALNFKSNS